MKKRNNVIHEGNVPCNASRMPECYSRWKIQLCGAIFAPFFLRAKRRGKPESPRVCPRNWNRRWRKIRQESGFGERWVQDVLRHTYASHHAKHFRDLPRLQLNMGHRSQSLLRSRYVNMRGLSKCESSRFFN